MQSFLDIGGEEFLSRYTVAGDPRMYNTRNPYLLDNISQLRILWKQPSQRQTISSKFNIKGRAVRQQIASWCTTGPIDTAHGSYVTAVDRAQFTH